MGLYSGELIIGRSFASEIFFLGGGTYFREGLLLFYLFIYLFIYLFVCLFVYLVIYLFIFYFFYFFGGGGWGYWIFRVSYVSSSSGLCH